MKSSFTRWVRICGVVSAVLVLLILPNHANAQIEMGYYVTEYSQNFNHLPVTTGTHELDLNKFDMPGWSVHRSVADKSIHVSTGSSNTGGLYSFGLANDTDRALGGITAAKVGDYTYNLLLKNTSGGTIESVDISYVGEQWRCGSLHTDVQRISFWYAVASTSTAFKLNPRSDDGWIEVPAMQFTSIVNKKTAHPLNGNADAYRTLLLTTLPIEVPEDHYLMLRWKDADEPEQDHGLAIDDVHVTWTVEDTELIALPVELVHFTGKVAGSAVALEWHTASEENNAYFEVERSSDATTFNAIGKVNGNGSTQQLSYYTFKDATPLAGTSYYRLRQVDEDGAFAYSRVIAVTTAALAANVLVYPTITSDKLYLELPLQAYMLEVYDQTGRQVMRQQITGKSRHTLNVSSLRHGNHVLVLQDEQGQRQSIKFLKQ